MTQWNPELVEALALHVDRYPEALDQIPTLNLDESSGDGLREHEEMIARMADHPEQIIFVESIYLAHVAEALVEWMKPPELEATRKRLGEMVDDALARAEESTRGGRGPRAGASAP